MPLPHKAHLTLLTESPTTDDRNPFDAISKGGWYEDIRDSHAISDDLHKSRVNGRD